MGKVVTGKVDSFMQSALTKYEIAQKKYAVEDYYGVINDIQNSTLDMAHALLALHGVEIPKYRSNYEYKLARGLYDLREQQKIPKCLFCYFDAYVFWSTLGQTCYYPDQGEEKAKIILERAQYLLDWIAEIIEKPNINYCATCNHPCTCKYDLCEAEDPDCNRCLDHRKLAVL